MQKLKQPTMLSFVKDPPNICSLVGLFCALLAIYFAILGSFQIAMVAIIWAVLFDWADGRIARKLKGRTDDQRHFGAQLDSLIDIISFGIFPAIFLLSYGNFNPWFLPGAFCIVAVSAIRLSYFNIFGLNDDNCYIGLALDNNMILLVFVFLFEPFIGHTAFSIIMYLLLMILLMFNISSIPTPKFTGRWYTVLVTYTIVLTAIYSFQYFNIFQAA